MFELSAGNLASMMYPFLQLPLIDLNDISSSSVTQSEKLLVSRFTVLLATTASHLACGERFSISGFSYSLSVSSVSDEHNSIILYGLA